MISDGLAWLWKVMCQPSLITCWGQRMVLLSGSFSKLCNHRIYLFYMNIIFFLHSSSTLWICARNLNLFFSNILFITLSFYTSATTWFSYCLIPTFCQLPSSFKFSGTLWSSFWSTFSYIHPNTFVDEPQRRKNWHHSALNHKITSV